MEPCAQAPGPIGWGPASCSLGAHFTAGEESSLEVLVQCSPWGYDFLPTCILGHRGLCLVQPLGTSFGPTEGLGFSSNPTGGGGSK